MKSWHFLHLWRPWKLVRCCGGGCLREGSGYEDISALGDYSLGDISSKLSILRWIKDVFCLWIQLPLHPLCCWLNGPCAIYPFQQPMPCSVYGLFFTKVKWVVASQNAKSVDSRDTHWVLIVRATCSQGNFTGPLYGRAEVVSPVEMDSNSRWELPLPCNALAALLSMDVWNNLAMLMSSGHRLFHSKGDASGSPGCWNDRWTSFPEALLLLSNPITLSLAYRSTVASGGKLDKNSQHSNMGTEPWGLCSSPVWNAFMFSKDSYVSKWKQVVTAVWNVKEE